MPANIEIKARIASVEALENRIAALLADRREECDHLVLRGPLELADARERELELHSDTAVMPTDSGPIRKPPKRIVGR